MLIANLCARGVCVERRGRVGGLKLQQGRCCVCVRQAFHHPNLLALDEYSFASDGKEAVLMFDYYSRGTLLDYVQTHR